MVDIGEQKNMVGILAEKPSAARNFAAALGGMKGNYKGTEYEIVAAAGHLYEFLQPYDMVDDDKKDKYKNWDIANLPWNEEDFNWQYCVRGESAAVSNKNPAVQKQAQESVAFAKSTLKHIKEVLSGCDEICIATDVDPTGEGQLLAWEILDGLRLRGKTITRMYHQDEAPASVQKAFQSRKHLSDMNADPEYKKALMRSQWDLLSMQWTRIATGCVNGLAMLRQGRLKSAMVSITGDGLKAVAEYKKIPFYQNRFRDENGNVYTNPEEEKYPDKKSVPQKYTGSAVVLDKKETKYTAPPKLIDLAKLAAMLAPKGVKSKDVLSVYQKMYEDQVVSYPRTEDKYITEEQFDELLPYVDRIADVVGVDRSLLTHRVKRRTHIKAGCAHGANRPGIRVPASLDSLKKYGACAPQIYEILAKNYLAMLCEDYEYEAQEGNLEKYPEFKGHATIPRNAGWKLVFQTDDDLEDPEDSGKGLGKAAEPFVHEGFPKKPPAPTTKWLMQQLEKHDVGTGATRTSIYADVTNENTKYPLLIENKGKLSMSQFGQMSYILLQDTHIGSVKVTEQLMSDMRDVAAGQANADDVLHDIQQMIVDDRAVMLANKKYLPQDLVPTNQHRLVGKCPKCGRDIIEGRKGYGCSGWKENPPCTFTIWKSNKLIEKSGKEITLEMAQELLTNGQCSMKNFKSPKGNTISGVFHLQEDGRLEFELATGEKESVGKCPRCGRPVYENAKGFGCSGYKDEEDKCDFFLSKEPYPLNFQKKTISAKQATALLNGEIISVSRLKSKEGKAYTGKFRMQDTGKYVNLERVDARQK